MAPAVMPPAPPSAPPAPAAAGAPAPSGAAAPPPAAGSGTTNTQPGSVVTVQADPVYKVEYLFIPVASHTPASALGGNSAKDSADLRGSLVAIKADVAKLPKTKVRLASGAQVTYRDATGAAKTVKGSTWRVENIPAGDKLRIFFGRDALERYRTTPLFELTPVRNSVVALLETHGLVAHDPGLTLVFTDEEKQVDYYIGRIVGSTWKRCSPGFSLAEVKSLLTGKVPDDVLQTVEAIYTPGNIVYKPQLQANVLDRTYQSRSNPAATNTFRFLWIAGSANNAAWNIADFDSLNDIAARVHPFAYAAVVDCAYRLGMNRIDLSSTWRPMLGSCAHRHGIGLDITTLHRPGEPPAVMRYTDVELDQQPENKQRYEAYKKAKADDVAAKQRVSTAKAAERKKQADLTKALTKQTKAQAAYEKAGTELQAAQAKQATWKTAYDEAKLGLDYRLLSVPLPPRKVLKPIEADVAAKKLKYEQASTAVTKAQGRFDAAEKALRQANTEAQDAEEARDAAIVEREEAEAAAPPLAEEHAKKKAEWDQVTLGTEPAVLKEMRTMMLADYRHMVQEFLDPWRIEGETRDNAAPQANFRESFLETSHRHHLHVTAIDSEYENFTKNQ